MKKLLSFIAILSVCTVSTAQSPCVGCPDFMDLTSPCVTAYTGFTARYGTPFDSIGLVPGRHEEIIKDGLDPRTGNQLHFFPPEGGPVIKLGNQYTGCEAEALVYEFIPEIENPILLLNFAVVFEDPNHEFILQPRFIVRVTDQFGNLLEACAEYDVTSTATIPGFQRYMYNGTAVNWRDWTKMSVDLSKFVGQLIKVQFINYDCGACGHYGYCYFTAKCMPNTLELKRPCTLPTFSLIAPEGFDSYLWSNGQTTDTATFNINDVDVMDSQITCKVISDMGCECTLYAYVTVDPNIINNIDDYKDTICEGETYNLHNFNLPPQPPGTYFYQLAYIEPTPGVCAVSVSELELEVIERYNKIKEILCYEEEFTNYNQWNDIPQYPTPGVWRDTVPTGSISTPLYCDTYDVLELVVSAVPPPSITIEGDPSPCSGDLVTYSFLGSETLTDFWWELPTNAVPVGPDDRPQITLYFTDGISGVIILHAANGCVTDREFLLSVTPGQTYNIQLNEKICQGLVYNDYDFNLGVQNELGFFMFTKHLQSSHGCDSTVTLGLNVLPVHSVHIDPKDTVLCSTGSQITLLALINEDEAGDATDCSNDPYPSVFIYNCGYSYSWSATPPDISVADTATPYITVTPSTTTTYTVTVSSDMGCKVSASQTVVVGSGGTPVAIKDTICFGETYSAYGINVSPAVAGTTTHTGSITASGCTVPINLTLTMLDEAKFIIKDTICSGDTYDDHGFHFDLYGDGLYIDTVHFISHRGCDSLVIFNFTINPQKETFINDNICQYDTYNKNGFDTVQNFAGLQILTKTFETSEGCDSTVVVRLNVYPSPVNVVDFGIAPGYPGITNTFTNWSIYYDESGIAVWEWYLNGTLFATTKDASYIFAEEGDYTVTLKVKSINGCWDEVTKIVTIDPCPTPTIIVDDPEVEVCGLETVTITGSFSDADKITAQILNSFGRKARITVDNNTNTFTVTYSPTIANVGNVIEIVLTATDSSTTCSGTTESIFITVKPKPKVRFKGECAE